MSAPSDNMPVAVPAVHPKPLLLRHLPYFIAAAIMVALAAPPWDYIGALVASTGRRGPVIAAVAGATAIVVIVLVLFLVFRPQGIFGERVAEKA